MLVCSTGVPAPLVEGYRNQIQKHAATMIAPFGTVPDPVTGCNGYAKFSRRGFWEMKWGKRVIPTMAAASLTECDSLICNQGERLFNFAIPCRDAHI